MIKYGTVCKSPEVNWLNFGDVIQVSKIDHQFGVFCVFLCRTSINYTGGKKRTLVNTGKHDYTSLYTMEYLGCHAICCNAIYRD